MNKKNNKNKKYNNNYEWLLKKLMRDDGNNEINIKDKKNDVLRDIIS